MSKEGEQIIDLRLLQVPLSTGDFTIGVAVRTVAGITEWDASPLGTTVAGRAPPVVDYHIALELFPLLREALYGQFVTHQLEIDDAIVRTLGIGRTGLNASNLAVAVSSAVARTASLFRGKPLYAYLADYYETKPAIPRIMCNLLGGGGHHPNRMKITEMMVLSTTTSKLAIEEILSIRRRLDEKLRQRGESPSVGLEGCLVSAELDDNNSLLLMREQLSGTNESNSLSIGLDLAAAQTEEGFVEDILNRFPEISYIEDAYPLEEECRYAQLLRRFPSKMIAGDDLIAGCEDHICEILKRDIINTVVIKLNHIGTITKLAGAIKAAAGAGAVIICSQRSRETARDTLSHLSIAFACDFLKGGSPVRERIANYSNLIALSNFI